MKKRKQHRRAHAYFEHKSHTGKRLPSGHTSYPLLAFILLCVGVLLTIATLQARAADMVVSARVPGEPPAEPAIITNPQNGDRFSKIPITVSGTCPSGNIVRIYRNDHFTGSVICSNEGTFSLETDLFVGENILRARVFNMGETEGPQSPTVTVYYDPPKPIPDTPSSGGPSPDVKQLTLKTDTYYKGYRIGNTVHWKFEIAGGTAPYAIGIDWGDGSNELISLSKAGLFKISHVYEQPGGYEGSYEVKLKASDYKGQRSFIQVVVLVNNPAAFAAITPEDGFLAGFSRFAGLVSKAWSFYLIALLMTASFWLGERRGIALFSKRLKTPRLRPRRA